MRSQGHQENEKMLTLTTLRQVRTSNSVKSFRSIPNATGISMAHLDRQRMELAEAGRQQAEARRWWLARQWDEHLARS